MLCRYLPFRCRLDGFLPSLSLLLRFKAGEGTDLSLVGGKNFYLSTTVDIGLHSSGSSFSHLRHKTSVVMEAIYMAWEIPVLQFTPVYSKLLKGMDKESAYHLIHKNTLVEGTRKDRE